MTSEVLEKRSFVFRLQMETVISMYSLRLENKVNNFTLENTKSFSLKITLATIVHFLPHFCCFAINYFKVTVTLTLVIAASFPPCVQPCSERMVSTIRCLLTVAPGWVF